MGVIIDGCVGNQIRHIRNSITLILSPSFMIAGDSLSEQIPSQTKKQ